MKNTIVYVTGASGFIGQHVVEHLLRQKYEVYAMVRKNTVVPFEYHPQLHIVRADLTDKQSLLESIPQGATIINLAANPYHKQLSYTVNVEGTQNLLTAAKKRKIKKIIHISSQATKIKKQGVYGKTKNMSDDLVRDSGIPYIILKPSLVYGPGSKGLFSKVAKQIQHIPFVPVFGDGNTIIRPLFVEDLAKVIDYLIKNNLKNKVYDIGGRDKVSYNDLYKGILKELHMDKPIDHIPVWIGLLGAKILSVLPNPPLAEDNILGSVQYTDCQPEELLKKTGIKPLSFKQGLALSFPKIQSEKVLKIALVGLGKMGILHASILSTLPNVEIVALVDNNPALYSTISSMGADGQFYTSLDEAFQKEKIDVVFICTPTFTHFPLAKTALKHSAHVFLEKPMVMNEDEAKELVTLAKSKNKQIGVGYTLVYNRTFQKLKEIIESKTLGNIKSFEALFLHSEVLAPKKGWMFNKATAGGGALMNPGPHIFSLLQYYFGYTGSISGTIRQLYSATVDDEAELLLSYPNYKGKVKVSWSVPDKPLSETSIIVYFQKGEVVVTNQLIAIRQGRKERIYTDQDLPAPPFPVFNVNPSANGESYYVEDALFIDSIAHNSQFPTDIRFAQQAEKMIHTSYRRAHYENKTV